MTQDTNHDKIPLELKETQDYIEKKQYSAAIQHLNSFLGKLLTEENKDFLALTLEILNAICDKTKETVEITLENMKILINHPYDWVRLESLMILKKIYLINPEKFENLYEKIESKLFDADKKIRENAVGLIAQILKTDSKSIPELYISYSRMLEDESWIVRARAVEASLEFIKILKNYPINIIETFQQSFLKLIDDPDEEVRGLVTEALKALFLERNPEDYIPIIQKLLENENWEVREKGIWLIGEVGKNHAEQMLPLLKMLVPMFADSIMMIQTKVIDAFVKIGQNAGPFLLDFFIPYMNDANEDIIQGISDSLIYISLQNKRIMLPKLINQLEQPNEYVNKLIGTGLIKIYMETPDGIEEELFRMFQSLHPEDWRQRKRVVKLLGNLCYLLKIKSIAAWTIITLNQWKDTEKDIDVLDEIEESIGKIKNAFDKLDKDIADIDHRKRFMYEEMELLQKLPQDLRTKTEQLIEAKKFTDCEIILEEKGNEILNKINSFEQSLNESDFKRFSVELLEDWTDIKEQLMEELSDVKSFEFNRICDGRASYVEELDKLMQKVNARIEVLKAEFDNAKDMKKQIQNIIDQGDAQQSEDFLNIIGSLREKIYNLEFDLGQIWLNNIEFKDFLKDITVVWINTKIEIQQFIGEIIQEFNIIHQRSSPESKQASQLKQKITFEFLNQEFQNTVMQAIQNQREILEKFSTYVKPINDELMKKRFQDARRILELTLTNLHSSIESSNREINRIYEEIDKINIPIKDANEIRRYMNHWNEVKDLLLDKTRQFKNLTEDQIQINEIIEYQKYCNPIPLAQLSRIMKIEIETLKEKVIDYISQHLIHAVIRDEQLLQIERPREEKFLSFSKKVEILGAKLDIAIRIYNPSKFFITDINYNFIYPDVLDLETNSSDLANLNIREFEPEATRIIHWTFKINKPKAEEKRYDVQRLLLNVTYRNPFNLITTFQKEMEIIL